MGVSAITAGLIASKDAICRYAWTRLEADCLDTSPKLSCSLDCVNAGKTRALKSCSLRRHLQHGIPWNLDHVVTVAGNSSSWRQCRYSPAVLSADRYLSQSKLVLCGGRVQCCIELESTHHLNLNLNLQIVSEPALNLKLI